MRRRLPGPIARARRPSARACCGLFSPPSGLRLCARARHATGRRCQAAVVRVHPLLQREANCGHGLVRGQGRSRTRLRACSSARACRHWRALQRCGSAGPRCAPGPATACAEVCACAASAGRERAMAVMSALGKMWKDLPAASKKPYEEAAQKEKAAYLAKHPEGPPPRVRPHGVGAALTPLHAESCLCCSVARPCWHPRHLAHLRPAC